MIKNDLVWVCRRIRDRLKGSYTGIRILIPKSWTWFLDFQDIESWFLIFRYRLPRWWQSYFSAFLKSGLNTNKNLLTTIDYMLYSTINNLVAKNYNFLILIILTNQSWSQLTKKSSSEQLQLYFTSFILYLFIFTRSLDKYCNEDVNSIEIRVLKKWYSTRTGSVPSWTRDERTRTRIRTWVSVRVHVQSRLEHGH